MTPTPTNKAKEIEMTRDQEAYELGRRANEDGEPRTASPFTLMGDLRAAWWGQGWEHQQAVREDWEQDNYDRCSEYA